MKQSIKKIYSIIFPTLVLFFAAPAAFAKDNVNAGLDQIKGEFGTGGLLRSNNLFSLITNVIQMMLMFVGLVAIVFIIIGGYQYIASAGNEEQAEKGRKTLINAVIGLVIIVLSYTIVSVVINTVQCRASILGFCIS